MPGRRELEAMLQVMYPERFADPLTRERTGGLTNEYRLVA